MRYRRSRGLSLMQMPGKATDAANPTDPNEGAADSGEPAPPGEPTPPAKSPGALLAGGDSGAGTGSRRSPSSLMGGRASPRGGTGPPQVPPAQSAQDAPKQTRAVTKDLLPPLGTPWLRPGSDPLITFTPSQVGLLRSYFEMHDADGSGSLDWDETLSLIADLGRLPKERTPERRILEALHVRAAEELGGTNKDQRQNNLEFGEFVAFFEAYYRAIYRQMFKRHHDIKGSDSIKSSEIQGVFKEMILAGFSVPWHKIEDVRLDVDKDKNGAIDFSEFCDLMQEYRKLEFEHLDKYAGYDPFEYDNLLALFDETDNDNSGLLTIGELSKIVEKTVLKTSLESQGELESFAELFSRLDRDQNCCLDFKEFLKLLRVWGNQAQQSSKQKHSKKASDERSDRRNTFTRRMTAVYDGGVVSEEQINEAMAADVEDAVLAHQWKMAVDEVRVLRESFDFADADGSGSIDAGELGDLLKNLGYPAQTTAQKAALATCMASSKFRSELGFASVLALVDMYYNETATEVIKTVETEDGSIPVGKLAQALYQAGMYMSQDAALKLLDEARQQLRVSGGKLLDEKRQAEACSEDALAQMIRIKRKEQQEEWRKTYGFDRAYIHRVQQACARYRKHSEEGISLEVVFKVLEDLGCAPTSEQQRRVFAHALTRVDRSDNSCIQVEEVLLLCRHLKNLELRSKTQSEKAVANDCGLDVETVRDLREMFDAHDKGGTGQITFQAVHQFFNDLGAVRKPEQRVALTSALKAVRESAGDPIEGMTFLQILQVLRQLDKSSAF